jgi:hypothetical protein
LHARLRQAQIAETLAALDWQHNPAVQHQIRALLLATVSSAVLRDRRPERYSKWLCLQVAWTPGVQNLLEAGLLRLEPSGP